MGVGCNGGGVGDGYVQPIGYRVSYLCYGKPITGFSAKWSRGQGTIRTIFSTGELFEGGFMK